MTTKKKAAETADPKENAGGGPRANASRRTTSLESIRPKSQPRTIVVLPPIETVFGEGSEGFSPKEKLAGPRITSRASKGATKVEAERGKSSGSSKMASPKRGRPTIQGRIVESIKSNERNLDNTCQKLRELQRRKVAALKARIAIDNQLTALVAIELGYSAGLEEKDRKTLWAAAGKEIAAITDGDGGSHKVVCVKSVVLATKQASDGFDDYLGRIEKEMTVLAKPLPVWGSWAEGVRGFGLLSLAAVVGECGNIGSYSGPAALQSRLGLAPILHNGVTKMPSTWRSSGGLPAEVWTEAGYSPRRRSIMFVIGECLVKQNNGEFRAKYDDAKKVAKERHEDWTDGHAHNHAMLLATKLLVKRLWQRWRGQMVDMPPRVGSPKVSVAEAVAENEATPRKGRLPPRKQQASECKSTKEKPDAGRANPTSEAPKKMIPDSPKQGGTRVKQTQILTVSRMAARAAKNNKQSGR